MISRSVVWAGEDVNRYNGALLGGKGSNLLKLYEFAKRTDLVEVPNFFIVPTNVRRGTRISQDRGKHFFMIMELPNLFLN